MNNNTIILTNPINRKTLELFSIICKLGNPVFVYGEHQSSYLSFLYRKKYISKKEDLTMFRHTTRIIILPIDEDCYFSYALPMQSLIAKKYPDIKVEIYSASNETYDLARNKRLFQDFCQKESIPIAGSLDKSSQLFVCKPIYGNGSRGVKIVNYTEAMLLPNRETYLIQKFIDSNSQPFGISGAAHNGDVYFHYSHKRSITKPGFGGASLANEVIDCAQDIFIVMESVIGKLNWTGFFMIEYMRDTDGNIHIIEFNPRIWGSFSAGSLAFKNYHSLLLHSIIDDTTIKPIQTNEKGHWFFISGIAINPMPFIRLLFLSFFSNTKILISPLFTSGIIKTSLLFGVMGVKKIAHRYI
jgi:hypothetical protein